MQAVPQEWLVPSEKAKPQSINHLEGVNDRRRCEQNVGTLTRLCMRCNWKESHNPGPSTPHP